MSNQGRVIMVQKCCLMLLLSFSLSFGQVWADTTESHPLMVKFERDVHFENTNEEGVLLKAGEYKIFGEEDSIRFTSKDVSGKKEPVVIKAINVGGDPTLEHPEAFVTSIGEDELHVVVIFPGGRGVGAVGTFSGIRSRAAFARKAEDAYITVYKEAGFRGKSKKIQFKDGGQVFLKSCLDNKVSSFILVAPRGVSITAIDKHKICYNCTDRQATWWGWGVARKVDKRDLKYWGLHDDISGFEWRVDGVVPRCKSCRNMYRADLNKPRC